jgi:hypothetical protein
VAPQVRGFLLFPPTIYFPTHSWFAFGLKQKKMPPSHFSKRQAPTEPRTRVQSGKAICADPASRVESDPTKSPPPLLPKADVAGRPRVPDVRDAESRTFQSPIQLLAPSPESPLFH